VKKIAVRVKRVSREVTKARKSVKGYGAL